MSTARTSCTSAAAAAAAGAPATEVIDLRDFEVSQPPEVEALMAATFDGATVASVRRAMGLPPTHTTLRVNTIVTTRERVLEQLAEALAEFNTRLATTGRAAVVPFAHPSLPEVIVIPSAPPAVARSPPLRYGGVATAFANTGDAANEMAMHGVKEVILDRLCGEAVLRGSDVFARGIVAATVGIEPGDEVALTVDLDHVSLRGATEHKGRRVYVGQGRAEMKRAVMFGAMRGLAVSVLERVVADAPPLHGVLPGLVYAQNLPSTVVGHVLGPQPGETVIDMCAAPGGKTSHLAALMRGEGLLVSCDRSRKKAIEIDRLCQTYQLRNVQAIAIDSTQSVLVRPGVLAERAARQAAAAAAAADAAGAAAAEVAAAEAAAAEAGEEGAAQQEQEQEEEGDASAAPGGAKKKKSKNKKDAAERSRQRAAREATAAYEEVEHLRTPAEIVAFAHEQLAVARAQAADAVAEAEAAAKAEAEAEAAAAAAAAAAAVAAAAAAAADGQGADGQGANGQGANGQGAAKARRRKRKGGQGVPGAGKKGSLALPKVRGFHPESFDRVLLDPPCSALGLRPRLLHTTTLAELEAHVSLQRNLLWAAVWLLKPGGVLVFSTCTHNPLENEGNVAYALRQFPCLELVPAAEEGGPLHALPGACAGLALPQQEGGPLSAEQCAKVLRFNPRSDADADTVGFFCAKFVKRGSVL
jgi:16S rRNA C967 or C1407 C5-methylase (RsmB/RsmF family)